MTLISKNKVYLTHSYNRSVSLTLIFHLQWRQIFIQDMAAHSGYWNTLSRAIVGTFRLFLRPGVITARPYLGGRAECCLLCGWGCWRAVGSRGKCPETLGCGLPDTWLRCLSHSPSLWIVSLWQCRGRCRNMQRCKRTELVHIKSHEGRTEMKNTKWHQCCDFNHFLLLIHHHCLKNFCFEGAKCRPEGCTTHEQYRTVKQWRVQWHALVNQWRWFIFTIDVSRKLLWTASVCGWVVKPNDTQDPVMGSVFLNKDKTVYFMI